MSGGMIWTAEEEEFLALCMGHGLTNKQTIELWEPRFGWHRGGSAIRAARSNRPSVVVMAKKWRAMAKADLPQLGVEPDKPDDNDELAPTLHAETTWDPHPPEEKWDHAEKRNAELIEYHKKRHKAKLEFMTTKPIGISFISDQHITSGGLTDLARMRQDAETVRDTPGLYAMLGGDYVDNHIKHQSAMIASASKPGEEWSLADHYLNLFGYKVAAMCSGNHDDWTKDLTDVDLVGRLAKAKRIFYAPDYVLIDVVLRSPQSDDEQAYKVKVRHQYRFGSSLNLGHSIKRMWEMDQDDFDIGVLGHIHEPHCETFIKHGLGRLALRPGSYQYTSGHARRYGFSPVEARCPTAILFPNERRMMGFPDVREAASYLRWLREGWPETSTTFEG